MMKMISGALILLAFAAVAPGCTVATGDGDGTSGESTGTATQDLSLGSPAFDPFTCAQAATQCNGMHCCAFGEAMSGAHFGTNTFQCRAMPGADESTCYVDKTTFRRFEGVSVKACLPGFYMKGYHDGHSWATCCAYPAGNASTVVVLDGHDEAPAQATDPFLRSPFPFAGSCQSGTMHVCPGSAVMEGVNSGLNYFACGS